MKPHYIDHLFELSWFRLNRPMKLLNHFIMFLLLLIPQILFFYGLKILWIIISFAHCYNYRWFHLISKHFSLAAMIMLLAFYFLLLFGKVKARLRLLSHTHIIISKSFKNIFHSFNRLILLYKLLMLILTHLPHLSFNQRFEAFLLVHLHIMIFAALDVLFNQVFNSHHSLA